MSTKVGKDEHTGESTRMMDWQALGVSSCMARALLLRGFSKPTPIQRVSIPSSLSKPPRDILGMARTGSGKTLAYLIPILDRLSSPPTSTAHGPRSLILCPTRELAHQILRVGKLLDQTMVTTSESDGRRRLVWAELVGGDGLETQFELLASDPDIIVATPGRLLHLLVEMNMTFSSIEMAVFDEADRLLEMGFEIHLREIVSRLPTTRQSLLYSATLPHNLTQFTQLTLTNPVFAHVSQDHIISPDLEKIFILVQPPAKEATLLTLLETIHVPPPGIHREKTNPRGLIFVATKYHAEYFMHLLSTLRYRVGLVYGSLDQVARRTQMANFRSGTVDILVVTDIAARGLDLPDVDYVVNYDFPPGVRSFVHRVGRTARAGRSGSVWTMLCAGDVPFFIDLENDVLNRPGSHAKQSIKRIARLDIDEKDEQINQLCHQSSDLFSQRSLMHRSYDRVRTSQAKASPAATRQARLRWSILCRHSTAADFIGPFNSPSDAHQVDEKDALLEAITSYRPTNRTSKKLSLRSSHRRPSRIGSGDPQRSSTELFHDVDHFICPKSGSMEAEATHPNSLHSMLWTVSPDETAAGHSSRNEQQKSRSSQLKQAKRTKAVDPVSQDLIKGESGEMLPVTLQSGRYERWKASHRLHTTNHKPHGSKATAKQLQGSAGVKSSRRRHYHISKH